MSKALRELAKPSDFIPLPYSVSDPPGDTAETLQPLSLLYLALFYSFG